ncbi:hypothetical protein ACVBEH_23940, partial [Roseateles sp. GG27B]
MSGSTGATLATQSGTTTNFGATSATGSLTVTSAGAVTQVAAITANGLQLNGAGSVTLTRSDNNVSRISASSGGSNDGAISYVNAGALSVDTVGSVGITRTGNVTLNNLAGDLTLAQSAHVGGSALRLQSAVGQVTQSGGTITAGTLGVNAAGAVTLGQSNAVSSAFAAKSASGDVWFKNANGYQVSMVAADGSQFTAVDGISAMAASKNITLETNAGTLSQGAGNNISAT